ncbi:MAG: hypothetical protein K5917_03560 [Clostridiales bacterium]|nr:hypothetical protein [Clostridiales bacterium]
METKNNKMLLGSFLAFAIGLIIAIPLRIYQVAKLIEPESGFYSNTSNFTIPFLYIILIASAVAIIALFFVNKKIPFTTPESKNIVLAVFAIIFAVTLIIDAANRFVELFSISADFRSLISSYSFSGYFAKRGGFALILEIISASVSAVYFSLFAMRNLKLFGSLSRFKILPLFPLVWIMSRMICLFLKTIRFLNVSDIVLELFMLSFAMLFFFAFARIIANIEAEGSVKKICPFGIVTALLAFTVSIPRLIMLVVGLKGRLVSGYPFYPCDLAMAAFIIVFLVYAIKTTKDAPAVELPEENPENIVEPLEVKAESVEQSTASESSEVIDETTSTESISEEQTEISENAESDKADNNDTATESNLTEENAENEQSSQQDDKTEE